MATNANQQATRFLTEREICSGPEHRGRYPLARSALRREVAAGRFPPPIKLSPGRVVWSVEMLDEYDAKLLELARASRKAGSGGSIK